MACPDTYATPQDYADWVGLASMSVEQEDQIEAALALAVGDINLAREQTGACDCTLSGSAEQFLKRLQITIAASVYNSPCGRPSINDDMKLAWQRWCTQYLDAIRSGALELCDGETGPDWPAFGAAAQAWTEEGMVRVISNRLRES